MKRAAALASLALLAAAGACEHAQPFVAAVEPDVPFDTTFPRRLTFSPSGDVEPAWLPDGSAIVYALSPGGPNGDQCLGILPAEGGHLQSMICHRLFDADSTVLLRDPAVGPGGLLAYLRESSAAGALVPTAIELVVASMTAPDPGRVLLRFPFTSADGVLHGSLAGLHWLPDGELVYVAQQVTFTGPPLAVDTVYAPLRIERLAMVGDSAVVTAVPGTANATSLAVDTSGVLYFTLAGDSRVYRMDPGAASPSVWFDFGGAGAADGVQVHGNLLVALAGGTLFRVDVAADTVTAIAVPGSLSLSRPALSPSGSRVVAEAAGPGEFPDLWLFQVP